MSEATCSWMLRVESHGCVLYLLALPLLHFSYYVCLYLSSLLLAQVLLDDFSNCQGYKFLHDYLLYLERKANDETREVLRNVVLLIQSLVMAGFLSLEPTITDGGPFQDPDFQIPSPLDSSMPLTYFNIVSPLILRSLINGL